jgi:glycine dehydrogenase
MGVPLGYGGPHPGYFASTDDLKRKLPGRIIGFSKDVHGN